MDEKRNNRPRREEALRDFDGDDEYRISREELNQDKIKRTYSEKTRNSQRVRNKERSKKRYPEDLRSSRLIKGSRYYQEKKRKRFKISLKKKILTLICGILGLFIIFIVSNLIGFFVKIQNNCSIEAISPEKNHVVNMLVLGLDIGDVDNQGNESIKRTDTMLLVSYNPSNKNTTIVSIPRDTLINENGNRYKINAAYPMGGDSKVVSVVEDLLSIEINYLIKIDYEAFRGIIDAIGGVEMKIEQDMFYDDESNI